MSDIVVTELRPDDRARWNVLRRGYLEFYETSLPDAVYDHTWQRLMVPGPIFGFGVRLGDPSAPLVGIAHYLFHDHAWSAQQVCYLQDLFVDAAVRGKGAGRALIERVGQIAQQRDCLRMYWTTKQDNATARLLYDRLAKFNGFIRYDYAPRRGL